MNTNTNVADIRQDVSKIGQDVSKILENTDSQNMVVRDIYFLQISDSH